LAPTPAAVDRLFAALTELEALEADRDRMPVGAVGDVGAAVARAARGTVLEPGDLIAIGHTVVALDQLKGWLVVRAARAPTLDAIAAPVRVGPEILAELPPAFDDTGALSGTQFPLLGDLRARITQLRERIRATLDQLVGPEGLGDALQDRFVTERGGRFVVPVKPTYKRSIGIVHATSQSGETVFVEPAEVVERTNELKEVEAALAREERRILASLSRLVAAEAEPLGAALGAAVELDLIAARLGLGQALDGVVPARGRGGVLLLREARHPVLHLRGVKVVPNDLALDAERRALVLTGPNTGGKTVALKTLGLAALLLRAGVPVPVGPGSRVDFFEEVLADIGDLQTVREDLSTFSGHLLVLKGMLAAARPGALILLDEIGTGTDPAQGAALSRAVLEALVEAGARVGVTTHYAELKAIPADDPRFTVAAAQYLDGRPTYRLEPGHAGQSHAFGIALRMGLPEAVVARGRALLSAGDRQLSALMEELDGARARVDAEHRALAAANRRVAEQEAALAAAQARVEARRRALEDEVARGFRSRLREKEDEVRGIIAALQARPDLRHAAEALAQVRAARDGVESLVAAPPPAVAPPPPPAELSVGDRVALAKLGQTGEVVAVLGKGRYAVQVGGLRLQVRADELAAPAGPRTPAAARPARAPAPAGPELPRGTSLRTRDNSVDLRGMRASDALDAVSTLLDGLAKRGDRVGFILHGHGTGALKTAVRAELPRLPGVAKWRPCDADEGGDAWTRVEIG
jgi:DNA mismatch repair protein MutS2